MGSILSILASLAVGFITWRFAAMGMKLGSGFGIDEALVVATFWSPLLTYIGPKTVSNLQQSKGVTAAWLLAVAPVVSLFNFGLAFGISFVALPLVGKDLSLRIGLGVATASWMFGALYVFWASRKTTTVSLEKV